MSKTTINFAAIISILAISSFAQAADVIGGQTNVALDFATIETATGLALSGVSGDVISPGNIPDSVAFGINPRDAASLPTTFSYDSSDFLGTFSGTIEHTGSVFFNMDTVEVGNFTIGFDGGRAGTDPGDPSGFFVESTTGVAAILFDVVNIDLPNLVASDAELKIPAELAISNEFATFLNLPNLEGAVVGSALVEGVVPEPSSSLLLLVALGGLAHFVRPRRK